MKVEITKCVWVRIEGDPRPPGMTEMGPLPTCPDDHGMSWWFGDLQREHKIYPIRDLVRGGGYIEALFSEQDAEVLIPLLRLKAESLERDGIKVEVSRRA